MTRLETDLNYIGSLADQPAMTTAALKQEFDKAGNTIKDFINNTLESEITANIASCLASAKSYADSAISEIDLSGDGISYDNTQSGLEADNVQDAIDELSTITSGIDSRVTNVETTISNPLLHLVDYDITIQVAQGYGTHTTRTLPDVEGYTFIGCTYPYCQHSCSCSISSIDGKVITVEGFNGGGGNPRIHFKAMYMKD